MSLTTEELYEKRLVPTRRGEARYSVAGRAVAQVVRAANPNLLGITFRTDIVEASRCGVRLVSTEYVEDCQVDVWVSIEGQPDKLFLSTEVRWASWEQHGEYELGLEVINKENTDADQWFALWD